MESLEFKKAFKYPFNRLKGLLNVLWIFVPIFGWFALFGYVVRIVNEFVEGKFEELPKMQFMENMKLGFMMFLKSIPFMIVYMIIIIGVDAVNTNLSAVINMIISWFVMPLLSINFMKKKTIGSYFEFSVLSAIKDYFADYIVMLLKTFAITIVFAIMMIVLVGIPAIMFTSTIFYADFYRRYVKG